MKLRLLIALIGAALAVLISSSSFAQFANNGVTTTPASGTIANTNTFQVVSAFSAFRRGGYIQNTGTAFQYVYFAGNAANCASATKAASLVLQPPNSTNLTQGGSVTYANGQTVIQDTVCVTGTATDTFVYATQQ